MHLPCYSHQDHLSGTFLNYFRMDLHMFFRQFFSEGNYFHYRYKAVLLEEWTSITDRSVRISAEHLSLQIQILPWIESIDHYRCRLWARNELILWSFRLQCCKVTRTSALRGCNGGGVQRRGLPDLDSPIPTFGQGEVRVYRGTGVSRRVRRTTW